MNFLETEFLVYEIGAEIDGGPFDYYKINVMTPCGNGTGYQCIESLINKDREDFKDDPVEFIEGATIKAQENMIFVKNSFLRVISELQKLGFKDLIIDPEDYPEDLILSMEQIDELFKQYLEREIENGNIVKEGGEESEESEDDNDNNDNDNEDEDDLIHD
jgi:hypothetical protein